MRTVILTGAGISAESGVPTFRDNNGLWENHNVEDVATPEAFKRDPVLVHRFYNERRQNMTTVHPNAGHEALARMQSEWDDDFLLVTQNVDDLHERAGSTDVLHMHGEIARIKCTSCSHDEITTQDTSVDSECPSCHCNMRPDVVWFGEYPYGLPRIMKALSECDIFIAVGTSGQVQPASLFASEVLRSNPLAKIIEVNPHPTGDASFDRVIRDSAANALPVLVDELIRAFTGP